MNVNNKTLVLGLVIVLTAAALFLLDIIEVGVAGAIGIIGIGLIVSSGSGRRKQQ